MSSNQGLININSIYSTQGKLKKDWEYFIKDINNDSCSDKIISLLNQNMKDTPKNELTVDIIDFIIDYGNQKMISLIAQKQFLDIFLNLLKSETNAGVEIQKKASNDSKLLCPGIVPNWKLLGPPTEPVIAGMAP